MEYASKGVANAGLTTGIIGTALGALNGGLLNWGGWNGAGNGTMNGAMYGGCGSDRLVNRYEMSQEQRISDLQSQIALRDANIYNDQKSLELYKYIDGQLNAINAQLGAQAVQNQATKDSFQLLQERLCCEEKARKCADNAIVNYANATFYPKMVADVTTGTTTTAQTLYNPLPVDTCGC